MKEFLTIGELANIFEMDVQLLRHYDAKGLLVPSVRNPDNSRRMYRFDQIYPLATIRYLRKLGYPLKKIDEFMHAKDVQNTMDTLTEQAALLRRQCEELIQTVSIIQKKLAFIDRECQFTSPDAFSIKSFPERYFIFIGDELNLFTHELFYFYPTVGFYRGHQKSFGAYLFEESIPDPSQYHTEIKSISGGRYVCGYHYGPYTSIYDSIAKLFAFGAEHTLSDCVVTINIIDQFVESHPENYITGLQVRILE